MHRLPHDEPHNSADLDTRVVPTISRRHLFRRFAGLAGGLIVADAVGLRSLVAPLSATTGARWSDPNTWGGRVPGPDSIVTINKPVILDTATQVAGVIVEPGGELIFDPARSVTLSSTGNVIVRGMLRMRPAGTAVHRITFLNVNEAAFVGGGMDPVASDVGLWVVDTGSLDVAGAVKTPWARLSGGATKGATQLRLDRVPVGWSPGDRLVVTPTSAPTSPMTWSVSSTEFSETTVTAVSGSVVTVSTPLAFDHPQVNGTWNAEVLNLTRSVQIEGTATGRTHLFVRSSAPQAFTYAALRHVGPRKGGEKVLGRWPLHFHHCDGATRGAVLNGVVVTDAGSHAYAIHASHGMTLLNCVAYNVQEHAFWWDDGHATDDAIWDSCVAARVRTENFSTAGFYLGMGLRNIIRGCVAAGVEGEDGAGIVHPAQVANGEWTIEDCLAHNNRHAGFKAYINTDKTDNKVVRRLTSYRNEYGIDHGAYQNSWLYDTFTLYDNLGAGVRLRALPNSAIIRFVRGRIDQAGRNPYGVINHRHFAPSSYATRFEGCTFLGHTKAGVALTYADTRYGDLIDLVNCTWVGNELWFADTVNPACRVRIQDPSHGSISVRRKDQLGGTLVRTWNAKKSAIATFA